MNEFKKLSWRTVVEDSELDSEFLSEQAVASLHAYTSLGNAIKTKKKVKIHVLKERYIPGLKEYRPIKHRSFLTKSQKASCLIAYKLVHSGKQPDLLTQQEKYALNIYKENQSQIIKENALFTDFIRKSWMTNVYKKVLTKMFCSLAWCKWKEKVKRYLHYSQYYEEHGVVSLNFDENEACIDFQHLIQPLETGTLARYAHSTLKEPCILRLNSLKQMSSNATLNSKLSVSEDANIIKLLEKHDFDVAISASALKQIIDFTNTSTTWIIPVIIKEISIERDNVKTVKKKLVFIDKVLPDINPTTHDLNIYAYKRLLKLQFCQYEAFSYPASEVPVEIECNESSTEEHTEESKNNNKRVIHHNANYRIWNIKKSFFQNTLMKNIVKDKDINLLVRCKLDGCEETEQGSLVPIIIRPKIEQQIQYGANVPTKSELARDWTSLFFRLFSVLYRARIYSPKNEIIALEKCHIQKINSEAQSLYDYKPIRGLGVLQKLLNFLVGLDNGEYILQHSPKQESFVTVMKACESSVQNVYDLHKQCEDAEINMKLSNKWIPVDVNYILPAHEEHSTIPGMFAGFDTGKKKKKKKKGFVNNKKNNK